MRIKMNLGVDGYRTNANLKPELYDAHLPLESVIFNTRMRILDANICAVSLAIVLQEYASESITCDEAVQVHVADAIENFLSPRRCRVSPVEQTPMAIAAGNRKAVISGENSIDEQAVHFELGDASSFSSNASLHKVHISSNIAGFFSDDEIGFIKASISAAVFVAPDYAFSEIALDKRYSSILGKIEYDRYQALLNSINLKLTTEN